MRAGICELLWANVRRAVPIIWVDMLTTTLLNRSLVLIRGFEFTVWLLLVSLTGAGYMPAWVAEKFDTVGSKTPAAVLATRLMKLVAQWAMFRLVFYPLNGLCTFLLLDFVNVRMSLSNRWLPVLSVLPPVVVYLACQMLGECVQMGVQPAAESAMGQSRTDQSGGGANPVAETPENNINDLIVNSTPTVPPPPSLPTTPMTPQPEGDQPSVPPPELTPMEQMKRLCRLLPEPPMTGDDATRGLGSTGPTPVQLPVVQLAQPPTVSVSAAPTFAQRVASALACMRRQMSLRLVNANDTLPARPPTNTEWDTYLDRYWRIHQILPPPTQRDDSSKSVTVVWTSSKALGEDWSL